MTPERKIEWALELERLALAFDPRITRTDGASVSTRDGASAIVNSNGVARAWDGTSVSAYVVPLAADRDGRQQTGVYGVCKRWLARRADARGHRDRGRAPCGRAHRRAAAVPSARVPVMLHPDIAADWIVEMHDALSGESLLKQSSWLTGKLAQLHRLAARHARGRRAHAARHRHRSVGWRGRGDAAQRADRARPARDVRVRRLSRAPRRHALDRQRGALVLVASRASARAISISRPGTERRRTSWRASIADSTWTIRARSASTA